MARKEAPMSFFQLVNQLEIKDWQPLFDEIASYQGYTDEQRAAADAQMQNVLAEARNGYLENLLRWLKDRLNNWKLPFVEMYAILHNKDTREVWSEQLKRKVIDVKPPHIHVLVKLKSVKGKPNPAALLNYVAAACGVLPQSIEKPQRGRYAYDNQLAYLVHIKYKDKHQYSPNEVITVSNTGAVRSPARLYASIYEERREVWERGAATVKKQAADLSIDWLEEMILTGQISKSQIMLTDSYFEIYSRNSRRCDEAFRMYGERRAYKTMQALQNGEFKLTVFFITGRSGTGKSRFTKHFIQALIDSSAQFGEEKWRCCEAASSNPVDDYQGEEILRMDDLRGNAMSASDWLKLLDPYNITPTSARYRNKTVATRVIIITSEKDPLEYFYYARMGGGDRSEALDQFIRRIQALVQVVSYGDKFEDSRFMISTTAKVGAHVAEIPNSADKTTKKNAQVLMQYDFKGGDKEMQLDEAVQALVSDVIANNRDAQYKLEELAEAEAAAEAEMQLKQQEEAEKWLEQQAEAEQDYIEEQLRLAGM